MCHDIISNGQKHVGQQTNINFNSLGYSRLLVCRQHPTHKSFCITPDFVSAGIGTCECYYEK